MINHEFKWKHFAPEIILWYLRWYGSTPMSYATLIDMLAERGISVNRSTIYCWFIEYSPKLRKKLRRNYQFLKRCLKHYPLDKPPKTLNTDKHSSYANAMARLMSGFVMMNVNPLCGRNPPSYIDYLKLRSFFNNNESIAELIYRLRLFATTPFIQH